MLSINSTFHEIESALKTKGIKQVKNEMSVGENKLRRMLRLAGYEYDTSLKLWRYPTSDREDVRNMSFWAFEQTLEGNTHIIKSNTDNTTPENSNTSNTEIEKSNTNSNISNNDHTALPFTASEIDALRELAQLHINKQPIAPVTAHTDGTTSILERVQSLQSSKSERKTYVIDAELIQQFDAFCEVNRLKKSSVMSLAIKDLLAKYQ